MKLVESLKEVARTAAPISGSGTYITAENREQCVTEMQDFLYAVAIAKRAGATGYEIQEATSGRIIPQQEGFIE